MVKIFRFTTTTTPRRISYVGIRRISTGAQKILSQFSFSDGTERKALSLKVMITTTMTMNDDDDAGDDDGDDDGGDDGDDDDDDDDDGDDDGNDDGGDDGDDGRQSRRRQRLRDDDETMMVHGRSNGWDVDGFNRRYRGIADR